MDTNVTEEPQNLQNCQKEDFEIFELEMIDRVHLQHDQ